MVRMGSGSARARFRLTWNTLLGIILGFDVRALLVLFDLDSRKGRDTPASEFRDGESAAQNVHVSLVLARRRNACSTPDTVDFIALFPTLCSTRLRRNP
jgi:hypothetical protein